MRAGQLRHTIIIQTPTETNTGGHVTTTWAEYDTVRAGIDPMAARFAGREFWAAKQVQAEDVVVFRARYLFGVTQKMRVLYNDKAYDIKGVIDIGGRGREMLIYTTTALDSGLEFVIPAVASAVAAGVDPTVTVG